MANTEAHHFLSFSASNMSFLSLQALRLESERSQWEQRYLEEAAMRQVAIDTAAIPKDARIAALEKNTVENEHLIAVARAEKMKQFEDMQQSQVGWIDFLVSSSFLNL